MFSSAARKKIKDYVLGKDYDLSFAFIDSKTSHKLNLVYRDKDKPANVLSFPLSAASGEILIDREVVKTDDEAIFLFIHGTLHLKGYPHGSKMEAKEKELVKLFAPNHDQNHRHRTRHRKLSHSASRRRAGAR